MNENKSVEKRKTPVCLYGMTKEQIDAELQKGTDDILAGRVVSAEEVEAELTKEFGISFD